MTTYQIPARLGRSPDITGRVTAEAKDADAEFMVARRHQRRDDVRNETNDTNRKADR